MIKKKSLGLIGVVSLFMLFSACARVPSDGTQVASSSEAFSRLAQDIQGDCERMGGCTCIMDGIQTTCAVVFACLEAGFCVLAAR